MKVVIVALGFFLVPLRPLYPGERFGSLGSGGFGLLLATTLRTTFFAIKSIETIQSHI